MLNQEKLFDFKRYMVGDENYLAAIVSLWLECPGGYGTAEKLTEMMVLIELNGKVYKILFTSNRYSCYVYNLESFEGTIQQVHTTSNWTAVESPESRNVYPVAYAACLKILEGLSLSHLALFLIKIN